MTGVQPAVLRWARETAALSLEQAARELDLNAARGRSGEERLAAIEAGDDEPSRPLLLKMAKAYRRPLVALYLAAPPRTEDRGQDFRTLPGHQRYHPDVDALVRDIKARQGLIRSILEDDDAAPVDFVGQAATKTLLSPGEVARRMAERIGFSITEFRAAKGIDEAFSYLRGRIENAGVFVLLAGNLGSYHTNIAVELFRGFALADPIAPMIIINDQDARSAWSFTALHELTHVWLGETGISGADAGNRIEQYCNDVAAEILLPFNEVASLRLPPTLDDVVAAISSFADERRVSRPMVAYGLLRTGRLSGRSWATVRDYFATQYVAYKQRETEKSRAAEGGPSYYTVRRHRIGQALLGLMRRSLDEGTITYTKASRVLGVKPRSVEPLLSSPRGAR